MATTLPEAGARFTEADKTLTSIYSKLFYGNNLPAITPAGESFEPAWNAGEVPAIAALMGKGLELFLVVVRPEDGTRAS